MPAGASRLRQGAWNGHSIIGLAIGSRSSGDVDGRQKLLDLDALVFAQGLDTSLPEALCFGGVVLPLSDGGGIVVHFRSTASAKLDVFLGEFQRWRRFYGRVLYLARRVAALWKSDEATSCSAINAMLRVEIPHAGKDCCDVCTLLSAFTLIMALRKNALQQTALHTATYFEGHSSPGSRRPRRRTNSRGFLEELGSAKILLAYQAPVGLGLGVEKNGALAEFSSIRLDLVTLEVGTVTMS